MGVKIKLAEAGQQEAAHIFSRTRDPSQAQDDRSDLRHRCRFDGDGTVAMEEGDRPGVRGQCGARETAWPVCWDSSGSLVQGDKDDLSLGEGKGPVP